MPEATAAARLDVPDGFFARIDESPDPSFYVFPRKVTHIDERAIAAVTELYAELVPPGGVVLDLMSSWRSHLPDGHASRAVGLGLNREEMVDNPQLDEVVVHDVNATPTLPFHDATFDAVVCCVSVQYITRPAELFAEVARVLRVGAPFVVTFSNRCFPPKAVRGWLYASDEEHCDLVRAYFEQVPAFGPVELEQRRTGPRPIFDPLFAAWARRTSPVQDDEA